jgi:two-component system sensor histidine kinase ResE
VVGKLWLTIIVLVSLVLAFFSLFLNNQVDKSYSLDHAQSLRQMAVKIRHTMEQPGLNEQQFINHLLQVSNLFHTSVVLLDEKGRVQRVGMAPDGYDQQLYKTLLNETERRQLMQGKMVEADKRVLHNERFSFLDHNNVLVVGTPYERNGRIAGAVLLYQFQDQLSETDIKWWIFYAACIGIILTTIFAFFLSSRITHPLIQMKQAAEKMTKGQFSIRLPVRTHEQDEIADLAMTFNRMAARLEESIKLLSHEKEQLAGILQSMSDGVISIDADRRVILTNPPAQKLLEKIQTQEEREKSQLPASLCDFYQHVVTEHTQHKGDLSVQGHIFAVVMSPLYAKKQVRGVVAVLRDVTEARRLDKLRKDFVANVSHELRTPLVMLQGYSEALRDGIAETPEEVEEIAQVINEESERMGRLVHELLDLARMEAGHITLDLSDMQLEELIARMRRKFQNLAREQEVRFRTTITGQIPVVYWDEDKIEQVLTNLVDNAIRHTSACGWVEIHVEEQSDTILIQVKDNGSGIPAEDLPFIFERFYKADKARTRGQSGGTGLGLSIAKHLINAHQGEIMVDSELGEGTTFTIRLPLRVQQEEDED